MFATRLLRLGESYRVTLGVARMKPEFECEDVVATVAGRRPQNSSLEEVGIIITTVGGRSTLVGEARPRVLMAAY